MFYAHGPFFIPLAFFAQAHCKEVAVNQIDGAQACDWQHAVETLGGAHADTLVKKLVDRLLCKLLDRPGKSRMKVKQFRRLVRVVMTQPARQSARLAGILFGSIKRTEKRSNDADNATLEKRNHLAILNWTRFFGIKKRYQQSVVDNSSMAGSVKAPAVEEAAPEIGWSGWDWSYAWMGWPVHLAIPRGAEQLGKVHQRHDTVKKLRPVCHNATGWSGADWLGSEWWTSGWMGWERWMDVMGRWDYAPLATRRRRRFAPISFGATLSDVSEGDNQAGAVVERLDSVWTTGWSGVGAHLPAWPSFVPGFSLWNISGRCRGALTVQRSEINDNTAGYVPNTTSCGRLVEAIAEPFRDVTTFVEQWIAGVQVVKAALNLQSLKAAFGQADQASSVSDVAQISQGNQEALAAVTAAEAATQAAIENVQTLLATLLDRWSRQFKHRLAVPVVNKVSTAAEETSKQLAEVKRHLANARSACCEDRLAEVDAAALQAAAAVKSIVQRISILRRSLKKVQWLVPLGPRQMKMEVEAGNAAITEIDQHVFEVGQQLAALRRLCCPEEDSNLELAGDLTPRRSGCMCCFPRSMSSICSRRSGS
eukprot:gnl/MRDRNA2_/MRDRNA2_219573_c0_seq1.p1 gnl/MRDRNA2_/MRDRNA2_219573_c0~~gnl/MRDRNA2_/MRDRNA2_219573_c0_seq1.p1  ORF type:complete len:593 (-),score=94.69 gnl/MRDRNA2_/MRDRNA2_219573_c0_seq1:344-2122(-)